MIDLLTQLKIKMSSKNRFLSVNGNIYDVKKGGFLNQREILQLLNRYFCDSSKWKKEYYDIKLGEDMVWANDENGERIFYDYEDNDCKYPNEEEMVSIGLKKKRVCPKCHKPRIDINGVEDCDFCLQALTTCPIIDYACCGHDDPSSAYISFKDGRRWVLDTEWSR